jgi:hypothetical protein
MQATIEIVTRRVMEAYALMYDDQSADEDRKKIALLIQSLVQNGETDEGRLAVSALARLRRPDFRTAHG